jgi:two-component sensor histidine kinase
MNFFKKISLSFILILNVFWSIAQQKNIEQGKEISNLITSIEENLYAYKGSEVISGIDELFSIYQLNKLDSLHVVSLRIKALVQITKYDEALLLSNTLLKEEQLYPLTKIRTLIEQALLFEINANFEKSFECLSEVKSYYLQEGVLKDELYGEYLYRTSSWFRVQGNNLEALPLAEQAYTFGKKNNFDNVTATALLLISASKKYNNPEEKLSINKEALNLWRKYDNFYHMDAIYISIAKHYLANKEYEIAITYTDSSLQNAKRNNDIDWIAISYNVNSTIYEAKGDDTKALENYKQYKNYSDLSIFNEQKLKVEEINAIFEIEKKSIENETLKETLGIEETSNRRLIFLSVILFLLLFLVVYFFLKLHSKSKQVKIQASKITETNLELNKSVKQQKLLLKELNHRVKNNLALILSLVKFHSKDTSNVLAKNRFEVLEKRIQAISLAHEQFVYSSDFENDKSYNIKKYLQKIYEANLVFIANEVNHKFIVEDFKVTIDTALPIGIITNELLNNSIKHAKLLENEKLLIYLSLEKKEDCIHMIYSDNGSSFKFEKKQNSLGLFVIESMITQLGGSYTREGSKYTITLFEKNNE